MSSFPGPTSHSFISQRLRLHYVDWGNPEAPPLILQHGGRDHCRSWDWVAQELRHDWHVICPDFRGHGDSAWSPDGDYSITALTYDFAQLVHSLGYDEVTIIAHSMGGFVTTRYAGLYPEKVSKFINIEGLGLSADFAAKRGFPWRAFSIRNCVTNLPVFSWADQSIAQAAFGIFSIGVTQTEKSVIPAGRVFIADEKLAFRRGEIAFALFVAGFFTEHDRNAKLRDSIVEQ